MLQVSVDFANEFLGLENFRQSRVDFVDVRQNYLVYIPVDGFSFFHIAFDLFFAQAHEVCLAQHSGRLPFIQIFPSAHELIFFQSQPDAKVPINPDTAPQPPLHAATMLRPGAVLGQILLAHLSIFTVAAHGLTQQGDNPIFLFIKRHCTIDPHTLSAISTKRLQNFILQKELVSLK
jgi:hypothetical protein